MQFKQEELKNILSIICPLANKITTLPILSNIFIKSEKDNIKFISYDLENIIKYKKEGEYKEKEYLIDSKTFQDYINLITSEDIELNFGEKLFIESKTHKTNINLQKKEEYPNLPIQEKGNEYQINTNELKDAISQVIFASSTSDIKIELSGILFSFNEEELILASSDGIRLAEKKIKCNGNKKDIIISSKTLTILLNILSKINEDNIKIIVNDNIIIFKLKNITLLSNLINSDFPDYKQLIPNEVETEILINKNKLINIVKTNALFSTDDNINLKINDRLIINTESIKGNNKSEIKIQKKGEDNEVKFNNIYLLEIIENIIGDNIKIGINGSNKPVIFKSEINNSCIYILMPMK